MKHDTWQLSATMARAFAELRTSRDFVVIFMRYLTDHQLRARRSPRLILLDAWDQVAAVKRQAGDVMAQVEPAHSHAMRIPQLDVIQAALD